MRKYNYIVGFNGENQAAYGQGGSTVLLTLAQAKREIKTLIKPNYSQSKRIIYKLVEVKTID